MSTGRTEEGFVVVRVSRKSEEKTRKRAVWVRAEMGTLRWREAEEEAMKVSSQEGETERDFVLWS